MKKGITKSFPTHAMLTCGYVLRMVCAYPQVSIAWVGKLFVHHEERDHKELPHPRDAHLRIRAHHAEHVERADDYVLAPVQEQDDKDRPVMGKDPDQGDGVDEEERDDGGR